mmetsp:Transcript_26000/g.38422  ORF Transcript_26000/g.38422 Transcript_26000/m.38422 type:complete len:343 (-) Transcript_26000:50-1078(-)
MLGAEIDTFSPASFLSSLPEIPLVGSTWVISSAIFTTFATTSFLTYEPKNNEISRSNQLSRSVLLTLFRFFGSMLLGFLAKPNFQILQRIRETKAVIPNFAIPAIFLFLANFTNSISLTRIGIPLTYTSKCGIPLITLLLTMLVEGRKALPSALTMVTLIPIALGIAAAAWDSPRFDTFGFLAAIMSCTAQSLLNVTSKRAISDTGVSGAQGQRAMVTVGFAITVIYTLIISIFSTPTRKIDSSTSREQQQQGKRLGIPKIEVPVWLTAFAVTAYHVEYTLSFMFVKLVSPISFATSDAIRRLSIIISGHYMFGGTSFSRLNIFGVGLALSGALAYSFCSNL